MEPRDNSGKGLLIAHAICCGGPLLLVLIVSNAAFLLGLARSGVFWAGTALLLGGVGFFFVRRRRALPDTTAHNRRFSRAHRRPPAVASRVGGRVP